VLRVRREQLKVNLLRDQVGGVGILCAQMRAQRAMLLSECRTGGGGIWYTSLRVMCPSSGSFLRPFFALIAETRHT
jgi:hypothetical protein